MAKVTLDHVVNRFTDSGTSPYEEERQLLRELFGTPYIGLTAHIFGTSIRMELPYWNFEEDARQHALYCVRTGMDDSDVIVEDYRQRIFIPSRDILLGDGAYALLFDDIINNLPPGRSRANYGQLIREHYGFTGEPKTLEALEKELGTTRKRIRSLTNKALQIMCHPSRSDRIKDYLEERRSEFFRYLHESGLTGYG